MTAGPADASRHPTAAVVTVGDELLYGETVDGNAAWLGRELSQRGVRIVKRYTVGDDEADIREAVSRALDDASLVLVTGGLGPTEDDLTRPVVADLLDAPLEFSEEILSGIAERFRRSGQQELPERNRAVAMVPRGARTLDNPHGTAPGLALEARDGEALVVLLPGVPREMRGIVEGDLRPLLRKHFGDAIRPLEHRMIHTTGIPESELSGRVEEVLPDDLGPVTVAFLPDEGGVDLRLTAHGLEDEEDRRRALDRVEAILEPVVEPWRFRAESGDLVEAVGDFLEASGRMAAVAESCTGGLLAKRLTDRPGSSAFFSGGVVAYSNDVKTGELDVPVEVLEVHGAVSREVAEAMVRGVARRLAVDAAVAVTGIAGPGGGTEEKPVGLVWYAALLDGAVRSASRVFPGDRASVRERSAQAALALLHSALREESPG